MFSQNTKHLQETMEIIEKHFNFNAVRVWIENITVERYIFDLKVDISLPSTSYPLMFVLLEPWGAPQFSLLFLQVLYKEGEIFVLNSHIVLYTYVCHQFFPLSSASLLISNVLFHLHFAEWFLKVYYLCHSTWLETTWVRYFDVMFLSHYDKMMTICLFRFCFHKLEVLTCAHLLSWWYSVGNVSILFSP